MADVAVQLLHHIGRMTEDERKVLLRVADKMMGEGRREYGPLHLATDTRSAKYLREQRDDELADAAFYAAVADEVEDREKVSPGDVAAFALSVDCWTCEGMLWITACPSCGRVPGRDA